MMMYAYVTHIMHLVKPVYTIMDMHSPEQLSEQIIHTKSLVYIISARTSLIKPHFKHEDVLA